MTTHIIGFDLGFPESWLPIPRDVPDVAEWARSAATTLVSGASPSAPAAPAAMAQDAADVLAEQLVDVVRSVRDTGISNLRTAVLVRHPQHGVVDAMLTVGAQRDISAATYAAELDEVVRESRSQEFAHAAPIEGTSAAGPVAGMHALIAHPGEFGDAGSAALEERVVLGVFPAGTPDMVEVTVVARGVGSFDDLPQSVVDLVAGLTVHVGEQ